MLPAIAAADIGVAAADIVDVDRAVDVDVAAAPVDAAAPVIAARCPAPERIARAEGNPGGKHRARHIAERRRKVIGRIGGIVPGAVHHRRLIIRHVNRVWHGGLDDDDLLALLLSDRDLLLLGRGQLVVGLCLGPQALDRIHNIRLLRKDGVTQLLRPVELFAHHRQHRRRRDQRLDALVPALLVDLGLQRVALERLVRGRPAVRLHHLQRISRRHQNFGEQRIRIERDRRHQRIELLGLQQLLRLRGGRWCGGLWCGSLCLCVSQGDRQPRQNQCSND